MKKKIKVIAIVILLIMCWAMPQKGIAQFPGTPYIGYIKKTVPSTMGTDFWVTFGNNYVYPASSSQLSLQMNIAALQATDVSITFTANGNSYTCHLNAGESRRIDIGNMASDGSVAAAVNEKANVYLDATTGASNRTLHITSVRPVAVSAFDLCSQTSDATVIYPVPVWGTEYRQISYMPISSYPSAEIIIAGQDNTVITFYNNDGSVNSIQTLSAGQAYVNSGGGADLTGRHFTSDKPAAYFAWIPLYYIPFDVIAGDVMFEQMIPVNTWDTKYFIPNAIQFPADAPADSNNRIRIVASQDGTQVNYYGASLPATVPAGSANIASGGTLNSGQWVELSINSRIGGAYITGTKPIGVQSYLLGCAAYPTFLTVNDPATGDPDEVCMPGLNQMISSAVISPFMFPLYSVTGIDLDYTLFDGIGNAPPYYGLIPQHYALIVTPTANKGTVTMLKGSTPVTLIPANWTDDSNGSGMSFYRHTFDNVNDLNSSFTVSNSAGGIIVLCYGLACQESYYYNAGSAMKSLN